MMTCDMAGRLPTVAARCTDDDDPRVEFGGELRVRDLCDL